MLCDECGAREATVTLTVVQNNERTLRHLCPECMQRLGGARSMLSAIFAAAVANVAALTQQRKAEEGDGGEESVPDKTCPRCGLSYAAFRKSGRLGCPGCYDAFREELRPMLQQLHGRTQHAGRRPDSTGGAHLVQSRREELQRLMNEAVQREDFEQAAILRDQLRALAKEEAE